MELNAFLIIVVVKEDTVTITRTDADANALVANFDEALEQLRLALLTDPVAYNTAVLEAALPVMAAPGGLDELYARVAAIEASGVFANSDWNRPAISRETGKIHDYEGFVRHFYASYHPYYNGNIPVIHPQPAGIAVTDSGGRLVGRHAITIIRVGLDRDGEMRLYFFNPNNDSGQNWGQGLNCSTESHGERHGEASLPFAEFASRLCVFHYDPRELGDVSAIPETDVVRATELARASWAVGYE